MPNRIGLIAGSGQFPLLFARAARSMGWSIHAAAYYNETDPGLDALVDTMEWFHLGQLKRLLKYFQRYTVSQAVMMGAIRKTRMFTDIKPDMKAIALMAGLRTTHDDTVLKKVAAFFENEGIRIQPSTMMLPELLATPGIWTRRKPTRPEKQDMALGWRISKHIGRLDLGQCIVVGGGTVLAVEAIEGTDAAIRRGGALGNGQAVVVKVSKPDQDLRFDMPAIDLGTIESMHDANIRAMAVLANKTVVFDKIAMIQRADEYNMTLACFDEAQFDRL